MFETIREQIMELLSTDSEVESTIKTELGQRFPGKTLSELGEEVYCIQQLLVFDRVLKGIIQ